MIEITLIAIGTAVAIEFLARFEKAYKEAERPNIHDNR